MGILAGRVALVTGGSKGLGASIAHQFAEAGAQVVITFGSDAEAAGRLIASLPGEGHRASRTPVQDTPAVESLAAEISASEGRLDILVNNAGSTRVIPHADLRALDDEFFDFVLAVNLRGPFAMVRACQPLLKASGHGLVVNVGSVSGVRGGGSNVAYAAAKAGLHAMTMSLARALAPEIRVVAVAPSLLETPMTQMWTPEQRAARIASNPLKRIGQPEETAAVILGLATTMTFVNGTIIPVDGGSLL
ncbi:MAG TPA: SDR family oxidoreductase [Stellaceae bacterium]|nr:SDR family oxidoreductase [Stellaceae bacterium]